MIEDNQQQDQQDSQQDQHDSQGADQGADKAALSREAAQRRRQLREVEAERDALRERLDGHDRAEVERRASEELHDPADLFTLTSLEDLRGEDGALAPDKLEAALETIKREKPHWTKKGVYQHPDFHQGVRQSVEPPGPSFGTTVKKTLGG